MTIRRAVLAIAALLLIPAGTARAGEYYYTLIFGSQPQPKRRKKTRQQKSGQRVRIRKRPPGAERIITLGEKLHKFMQQDSRREQRVSCGGDREKPYLFARQQGAAK